MATISPCAKDTEHTINTLRTVRARRRACVKEVRSEAALFGDVERFVESMIKEAIAVYSLRKRVRLAQLLQPRDMVSSPILCIRRGFQVQMFQMVTDVTEETEDVLRVGAPARKSTSARQRDRTVRYQHTPRVGCRPSRTVRREGGERDGDGEREERTVQAHIPNTRRSSLKHHTHTSST